MKLFHGNIKLVVAVLMMFAVGYICSSNKDDKKEESKKEDTKKEETTKKEDTKKEDTKSDERTTTSGGRLYFCEDYKGREINVSERFSPGWLTVMVKLDKPIGVSKVDLRLERMSGGKPMKIIDTIPFDVPADNDYIYFQDKSNLKFTSPGEYRVTLIKKDGTPIVSGDVTIVD